MIRIISFRRLQGYIYERLGQIKDIKMVIDAVCVGLAAVTMIC